MNPGRLPPSALGMLIAAYVLCYLDRQIVNILAEPIKRDLGLSDTQLGLLTGLAFAVFYTGLGLPVARLSERFDRARIVGVAILVWSGFTAACGAAQGFGQLLAARIGVGVGESACTPAAHAMIADYTTSERRAFAMSLYMSGAPIGILLGMGLGGIVADAHGWRVAFLVAGAPGLLLGVLILGALKDPLRARGRQAPTTPELTPTFAETITLLGRNRTFWRLTAAASLSAFLSYGHGAFLPSYFLRAHSEGLAALPLFSADFGAQGRLGLILGVLIGLPGAAGLLLGGKLGDLVARRWPGREMIVCAGGAILAAPLTALALITPNLELALAALTCATALSATWAGPLYAALPSLVPGRARATAAAVSLLFTNLVGLGLGPLFVGALSDGVAAMFEYSPADSLRTALLASLLLAPVTALIFLRASGRRPEDHVS